MPDNQKEEIFTYLNAEMLEISRRLDKTNQLLESILLKQKEKEKYEHVIAKEYVISANTEKEFDPVNNPGYNRARIFLDAGFTPAHSAGLTVLLGYKNSVMGELLTVISSNGSCGGVSEPFDIAQLSGFHMIIKNHDSSQSTTVKNFRIVLYNEV